MRKRVNEILNHRELIRNLVLRDLKVKYKNSILGYFWSVLDPILTMALFIIVFSMIVRIQVDNYPVFLLTALLPWTFFQGSMQGAVNSLVGNAELIKKVYFPREIFPFTALLSNLINFLLSLLVLIPIILIYKIEISRLVLFLPIIIGLQISLIGGLSLFFSCLNVFFRDIANILNFLLRLWFYATPIFYPIDMVPEKFLNIYMLNPMVSIISLYRAIFLDLELPAPGHIALAFVASFVSLAFGFWFFHKNENLVLKRI